MKKKILTLFFSLLCLAGFAQNDHLEPVGGYFDLYKHNYTYYANIRSILFAGLSDSPEIRYFVIPSFETEYVLQIERDRQAGKNVVIVKRGKQSIWYTEDKSKIEVETWKNSISQEDVDLIKQLYRNAILKTQYVVRNSIGLDGTRYYFSVYEMGLWSGQTWSPGTTNMGKLVEISEKLVEEVKSSTFVGLSTSLRSQIKELSNALFL